MYSIGREGGREEGRKGREGRAEGGDRGVYSIGRKGGREEGREGGRKEG